MCFGGDQGESGAGREAVGNHPGYPAQADREIWDSEGAIHPIAASASSALNNSNAWRAPLRGGMRRGYCQCARALRWGLVAGLARFFQQRREAFLGVVVQPFVFPNACRRSLTANQTPWHGGVGWMISQLPRFGPRSACRRLSVAALRGGSLGAGSNCCGPRAAVGSRRHRFIGQGICSRCAGSVGPALKLVPRPRSSLNPRRVARLPTQPLLRSRRAAD